MLKMGASCGNYNWSRDVRVTAVLGFASLMLSVVLPLPSLPYVGPALVKDQRGRPDQPLPPLEEAEIAGCVAKLRGGSWRGSGPVVLMTYLTDLAGLGPWALGLSAAHHKIPLVVQGLGMRWGGVGYKLPAVRRAVQLLQALNPATPIAFSDGTDAVVANSPQYLPPPVRDKRTLTLSGECGSFPRCFAKQNAQNEAFQACRRSSRACYPNSGVYIGQPEALLEALSVMHNYAARGEGIEHNEDQSAANRMYYSQAGSSSSRSFRVEVDGDSRHFLSLFPCKGPRLRHFRNFTLCHDGAHNPLRYVRRVDGETTALWYNYSGQPSRPFIVHSSGLHQRLKAAYFGQAQRGSPRDWAKLFTPNRAAAEAARAHPVLVVDSVAHGLCHATTLGELTGHTM